MNTTTPPQPQNQLHGPRHREAAPAPATLNLLLGPYGIRPRHPAVTHWKQQLSGGELGRRLMNSE